ncbi:hypothetical protein ACFVTX_08130 [Agromyces sp. NPDC058136]|uniref:hypothetical protein n=1 Tax=Agromyces sp. NPDC058136 TaxID=3346354 RepID=UPI0036DFA455
MEALQAILWSVMIGLVAIGLVLIVTTVLTSRRMKRHAQMVDPSQAEHLGELLLERVRERSLEPGCAVSLSGFWREHASTSAERYAALQPLLRSGVLRATKDSDEIFRFFQFIAWDLLNRPVGVVTLNQRDWTRMATGATAATVIQSVHGTVVGTVSGGVVQTGDHSVAHVTNSVDHRLMMEIIAALRADATRLAGIDRERAESLADAIENDASKGREGAVLDVINSLSGVIANSAGTWASTAEILTRITSASAT